MKKLYLFMLIAGFVACKKEDVKVNASITDGTYTGTFLYSNRNPAVNYVPLTGNVTLIMKNRAYTCTSPSTSFGAAARGRFDIPGQQIVFTDSLVHTANFDGNIVLNGTYDAVVKDDSLFLTKTVNTYAVYSYKLKKQ
ncbi:hypothetical protein [Mucilaginibacter ginkgonis]|uniref:Lipocalin-like protein n=1 Tax=Mucilaginibacter ginkgonis TaxID=2682091 RepID=A0A6I4HXW3_9SPHI|nr:hypothetical protein [Mucilaginibacter ginkgonis]QQL51155.1 hypothetical protein GO620_006825 [Mucilaginibacter ginkgonis]